MAQILDEGEYGRDEPEIDNQVFCPRCGWPDCEILSEPRPGSWWGAFGKARCNDCHAVFGIEICEEGDDAHEA